MTLRTELQSSRDLLNFDSTSPLAGMYHDERKASLIQAGTGLLTAAVSVVYPPLALASPATLYGGYKAAALFRPAALLIGGILGLAAGSAIKQEIQLVNQPPVETAPALQPVRPEPPSAPTGRVVLALARPANTLI